MDGYIVDFLGDELPFCVGIAIFIFIQVAIGVIKYSREKLKLLFSYGRGKVAIITSYLLVLCAIMALLFIQNLGLWLLILLYVLIVILIVSIWGLILFQSPIMCIYEKKLKRRLASKDIVEWQNKSFVKPWYIFTVKDRLKYVRLCADIVEEDNRRAYELLDSVKIGKLFPWEKDLLLSDKAYFLKKMGANEAANILYSEMTNLRPIDFSMRAVIYEEAGDLDQSYKLLNKLNNCLIAGTIKDQKHIVANNLGRIYFLRKNFIAAADYYKKAVQYAVEEKDNYNIEAFRDNLIMTLLKINKSEAEKVYKEHIDWLNSLPPTVWRKVSLANIRLKYCEATNDLKGIKNVVREVEADLDNLPVQVRIDMVISTALIITRFHFSLDKELQELIELFPAIMKSSMPQRFFRVEKLMCVFNNIIVAGFPLSDLRDELYHYWNKTAYNDLADYINQLPEYMVYDRCYFMKAQAYNWNKRSNDFVNYKDVMMQIADIYHKNELNYDYLITLVQIIDEAYRANNISGAIGIFPISRYEEDIREILTNVEEIMVKFIGYPQLAEVHLRLSYDYLCLQDYKNAERHLDYFNSLKIPLLSMDYHSREMYKALNEALNRQS